MDPDKVLLGPSAQPTIKQQQGSKELSRIIGDNDDYDPELKLSKYDEPSPRTIGERVKLKKTNIPYTIPSPPRPKIIIRTPPPRYRCQNINTQRNASKINNSICTCNRRNISIYLNKLDKMFIHFIE